jgi:hypothetical protein
VGHVVRVFAGRSLLALVAIPLTVGPTVVSVRRTRMPLGVLLMQFVLVGLAACRSNSASRTAGPGRTGNGHHLKTLSYDH